jgi:hypothetical protein
MMRPRHACAAVVIAVVFAAGAAPGGPAAPEGEFQQRVERSIAAGVRFLTSRIDPNGRCKDEFPPGNPRFGGVTSLCVYSLLTAGADHKQPEIQRSLKWLTAAKLRGTYAVAMRACALASLNDPNYRALLTGDAQWLVRAAGQGGGYTYTSLDNKPSDEYDNSNSQMAVLGVWAAASREVEIPPVYWQQVEKHWTAQQQIDGGWGYRIPPRAMQTRSYGSMTAAGLATLYVCFDNLRREEFIRCTSAGETKPIADAMKWLEKNFSAIENPGKDVEWYYYWLYCLQRAGLASGLRSFGAHDWYKEGAAALLSRQNEDGSWHYGDRTAETSFAVIFLVRGSSPVVVSKLRYEGKWNARPRDAANLARWLSYTFERPVNWQIVDAQAPLSDWQDASILYISGAGPLELTEPVVGKLRDFVLQGGMILSEAACNSGDFTLDVQKLYQRLFPQYPLRRIPDKHPMYSLQYAVTSPPGLLGVSNGARFLAIHAPREISLGLQFGPGELNRPTFELMGNLYLFATERATLRPRGLSTWPASRPFEPAATIRLARLKCGGNYDPEPMAFKRLAILMARQQGILLDVSEPVPPAELDASKWPVAHWTGTEDVRPSEAELGAMKKYLAAGGTLIIDATGGSEAFGDAAEKAIVSILGNSALRVVGPSDPLFPRGPNNIQTVTYRKDYAPTLTPTDRNKPFLECAESGGRAAVYLSRRDLTAGLCGYAFCDIRGYSPSSAVAVMTNLLCRAAGVRKD